MFKFFAGRGFLRRRRRRRIPCVEKRKYVRCKMTGIIKYKSFYQSQQSSEDWKLVNLVDVSLGGFQFLSPRLVPLHQNIYFKIYFLDSNPEIFGEAKPVWSSETDNKTSKSYRIGSQFVDLNPRACEVVLKKVSEAFRHGAVPQVIVTY